MNIINVGDPRTISLLAGQTISVTTTGTITATCVSGLGLTAGATIGSIHGSTVFGSYSADGVIKLTATDRDGAYEVNTDTSAQIKSVAGTAGLAVLDSGSGLDFGSTPIAPLHTFPAFDSTAITTAAQYYANIDAWAAALPQVTKTDLGVSSDGLAANNVITLRFSCAITC